MATVADRLAAARARLESAGVSPAGARLDAEVLARHALGWDRALLIARGREPEPAGFEEAFARLIARRAAREPVAQITGTREFWGLDFAVSRDVLTPRPETELIVEEVLKFAGAHPCRTVIDVGTGSGCLAVAIAHERPDLAVYAIDISAPALAVARQNAARHGVLGRVTFIQGDLLAGINLAAEVIVANPPYVPSTDAGHMQPEVVRHEPHEALFGGPGGLDIVGRLLRDAPANLAPGGRLIVEFGFGQEDAVSDLAREAGWRVTGVREDLQGIPRTLVLAREAP
jgi:release factor glutamine methyltransferase